MSFWPFLPVWPLLLLGCAVCSYWNWRAGLSFAICVILVRVGVYFELNNALVYRMVLYSVISFVVLFLVDRVAGGFFALISALLIAAMLGFIEVKTQVLASEAVLALGMIASAFIGPTGGLLGPLHLHRFTAPDSVGQVHHSTADPLD